MSLKRDEQELLGALNGPLSSEVDIADDGGSVMIEDRADLDGKTSVDIDEDPFLDRVVDNDGYPGFHPFVHASRNFEEQEGVAPSPAGPDRLDDGDDDEFHQRLRDDAAATVAGGGDELARLQGREAIKQAREKQLAPYVRINPVSAPTGQLGGDAVLSVKAGEQAIEKVCQWSAASDVETQPVTITLVPTVLQTGIGSAGRTDIRSFARVRFGTRATFEVEVDIGIGQVFTINASEVDVSVGLEPSNGTLIGNPGAQLSGQISFWPPSSRQLPLQRTLYLDDMADAEQRTVKIPAFARRVTVVSSLGIAGNVDLTAGQGGYAGTSYHGFYGTTVPISATNSIGAQVLPLTGDVDSLRVTWRATTPNDSTSLRLIFELGL